jgi:hypothetical protein
MSHVQAVFCGVVRNNGAVWTGLSGALLLRLALGESGAKWRKVAQTRAIVAD